MDKERIKQIVKASWIAVIGNSILALVKIVIGIISGSLAVMADGIDSASDIITSLITLVTGRIISKPPNIKYPYGYSRADTIAAKFLSFIIFFAGAQMAMSSIGRLIHPLKQELPALIALYVTCFSVLGKLLLSKYLNKTGKRLNSLMLIANARNMKNDVLISCSVLIGLIFTIYFEMPLLDSLTALLVSFWILKVSFELFGKTNEELKEGNSDPQIYKDIFVAVLKVNQSLNPHRLRLRRLGNLQLVEMDIEVDGNMSVKESHIIAMNVEKSIKWNVQNVYDIMVHVEPRGNQENEKFGIAETDLKYM